VSQLSLSYSESPCYFGSNKTIIITWGNSLVLYFCNFILVIYFIKMLSLYALWMFQQCTPSVMPVKLSDNTHTHQSSQASREALTHINCFLLRICDWECVCQIRAHPMPGESACYTAKNLSQHTHSVGVNLTKRPEDLEKPCMKSSWISMACVFSRFRWV